MPRRSKGRKPFIEMPVGHLISNMNRNDISYSRTSKLGDGQQPRINKYLESNENNSTTPLDKFSHPYYPIPLDTYYGMDDYYKFNYTSDEEDLITLLQNIGIDLPNDNNINHHYEYGQCINENEYLDDHEQDSQRDTEYNEDSYIDHPNTSDWQDELDAYEFNEDYYYLDDQIIRPYKQRNAMKNNISGHSGVFPFKKKPPLQLESSFYQLVDDTKKDLLYRWLSTSEPEYSLPAAFSSQVREQFHKISRLIYCKSKSKGSNPNRVLVVYRTEETPPKYHSLPLKRRKIISALFSKVPSLQHFGEESKETTPNRTNSTKLRHGQIVGEEAPPICEDNVGNRLLQKLGWSPGSSLGKRDTNAFDLNGEPIKVIYRKKNSGLGS